MLTSSREPYQPTPSKKNVIQKFMDGNYNIALLLSMGISVLAGNIILNVDFVRERIEQLFKQDDKDKAKQPEDISPTTEDVTVTNFIPSKYDNDTNLWLHDIGNDVDGVDPNDTTYTQTK